MSKNFEKEYKEYLNAQAPDLWERIEAGIDAAEQGAVLNDSKVIPMNTGTKKGGKKKSRIRYQHYQMFVSAVACMLAIMLIVPVYRLIVKDEAADKSVEVPTNITNVTIENTEEIAMEEEVDTVSPPAEADTKEETMLSMEVTEVAVDVAQTTENEPEIEEPPVAPTDEAGSGDTGQLATGTQDMDLQNGGVLEQSQEDSPVLPQEEMTLCILSEGLVQENGTVYEAVAAEDLSSAVIKLLVPVDSEILLEKDQIYVITLQKAEDAEHYNVTQVRLVE